MGDEHLHDALRGVESPPPLPSALANLREIIHRRAEHSWTSPPIREADVLMMSTSRRAGPCRGWVGHIARQHAFERGILTLNRAHGVVNDFCNLRRLGLALMVCSGLRVGARKHSQLNIRRDFGSPPCVRVVF